MAERNVRQRTSTNAVVLSGGFSQPTSPIEKWRQGRFNDVVITTAGGEGFPAHRIILATDCEPLD